MDNIYQLYLNIIENPDKVMQEQYGASGDNYSYNYLKDVTGDGIPEIILQGSDGEFWIIEKNGLNIGTDKLVWTEQENVFYSTSVYGGYTSWIKNEMYMDENGMNKNTEIEAEVEYTDFIKV